jgi:prepilin-type N-terminal cleavage/methylation domain-containing protein
MMHHLHGRPIRRAFTLTEILVVIAIMAILAALGAWGVFAIIGNQQRRNTENTIMVVNKVLQNHWKFVIEEAKKDTTISPAVQALAAPDPTGDRARVLWIKVRLMEAFPQTFAEIGQPTAPPFVYTNAFGTGVLIPPNTAGIQQRYIADYQRKITATQPWPTPTTPTASTNTNTASTPFMATPSSACLLIALSANRDGSSLRQDDIKFAVKDTDLDGVPEIVDGWGRPLAFFRFPTGSNVTSSGSDLQAANPAAAGAANKLYADPTDSTGMLLTSAWLFASPFPNGTNSRQLFEQNFHPVTWPFPAVQANNPLQGTYVIPAIVSAGKNGNMGLSFPSTTALGSMNISVAADEADNIYSYQLRGN